jgi:hypothetical protein
MSEPNSHSALSLLADVNLETGSDWELEGRLAGGVFSGAWRIRDDSSLAVFKWHDPTSTAPVNPDAPRVVAYLRANGYPTPAWLAAGTTRAGIRWSVQEFISGTPMGQLDVDGAELIIGLVELQRRLTPPTSFSWSAYMFDLAFGPHASHDVIEAAGGHAASVLREVLAMAAPYEGIELPDAEMVHCDLSVANILLDRGRLSGVIDLDAVGRGCAVYDVLAPALADVIWSPVGGPIDLLHEFAIDTYGSALVRIAATALVAGRLAFVATSAPGGLDGAAEKCMEWVAEVCPAL